jgi:hypothetical protein
MTDVLVSPDGSLGRWNDVDASQDAWQQQIPIFFSNPDLLWVQYHSLLRMRDLTLFSRATTIPNRGLVKAHSKKRFEQYGSGRQEGSSRTSLLAESQRS